jgi:hypothetical protein
VFYCVPLFLDPEFIFQHTNVQQLPEISIQLKTRSMKTVLCEKETYRQCHVQHAIRIYTILSFCGNKYSFISFIYYLFFPTVIVRSGSIRNCGIAHSALTNLETLRNCVLRTMITKLWNCVLRT